MLSLLSYKAIDTVFSRVFIPAIVILSIAVSISTSNIYMSFSISYYKILLSLITLSISLIEYITGPSTIELLLRTQSIEA